MSVTIPRSDVDLFDDAVLADPYPVYAELRDLGPAVWLGAGLSRIEVPAILESLARRVERIDLAGEPRRHLNNVIRGLESLPVTVSPLV